MEWDVCYANSIQNGYGRLLRVAYSVLIAWHRTGIGIARMSSTKIETRVALVMAHAQGRQSRIAGLVCGASMAMARMARWEEMAATGRTQC